MSDVFVVGALHLDVVVDAPRLPALDETLIGDRVAYRFGGKGGNQALAAARMGARVAMAGRVGEDAFAGTILAVLDEVGVDRSQVLAVPGSTGMSVAIVEAQGEYGAVVVSGVNRTIDPTQADPGDAKVIILQNEIPEDVNLAAVNRRGNARIILNAAPARTVSANLLQATNLLVVNSVEAAQMTGGGVSDLDVKVAAEKLVDSGPQSVVITMGSQGAVLHDGRAFETMPPPAQALGSSHGAGDAFIGALAAELARSEPPQAAVRFAMAAAAYFVQTPPDAREAIKREDVENWLAVL